MWLVGRVSLVCQRFGLVRVLNCRCEKRLGARHCFGVCRRILGCAYEIGICAVVRSRLRSRRVYLLL